MDFLTIDDFDFQGKTVFVRADLNTPIDPKSGKLLELHRIKEASFTVRHLDGAKIVMASHQGRVGRYDYVSMEMHAEAMSQVLGKKVKFVEDVFGSAARKEIKSLQPGEILLLDNLRFAAEENYEFAPEEAVRTHLVQRLAPLLDLCVLDAFPTAHRAHPSIVGFAEILPTCAGYLVARELKSLNRVMLTSKAPYTAVLGGSKVSDRLEAISALIENGRADNVLLTGLIGLVFLRAAGILKKPLPSDAEKYVGKAQMLLSEFKSKFVLPEDVAVEKDGERREISVAEIDSGEKVLDIGEQTIRKYSKIIKSSGTIFMSGPPGVFEKKGFEKGTDELLLASASSLGTTIISGGHLSAALERLGVKEWIDHVSTAGGALVMFLAGKRLPLIEALSRSAKRIKGL
ncbi:MAG: phosphoglycerate kinase [Candidatus Caldarchaeum sp.]|nr:phosphoglycerate kinase [Candidatus Caldarchaeum sp.]